MLCVGLLTGNDTRVQTVSVKRAVASATASATATHCSIRFWSTGSVVHAAGMGPENALPEAWIDSALRQFRTAGSVPESWGLLLGAAGRGGGGAELLGAVPGRGNKHPAAAMPTHSRRSHDPDVLELSHRRRPRVRQRPPQAVVGGYFEEEQVGPRNLRRQGALHARGASEVPASAAAGRGALRRKCVAAPWANWPPWCVLSVRARALHATRTQWTRTPCTNKAPAAARARAVRGRAPAPPAPPQLTRVGSAPAAWAQTLNPYPKTYTPNPRT